MFLTQATRSDRLTPAVAPEVTREGSAAHGTEVAAVTPWPSIRRQTRAILIAAATCLVVLVTIELAFFRSGFFAAHVAISNPQTPVAKLVLAQRHTDRSEERRV